MARRTSAFTLVELIVAVGVLAVVLVYVFGTMVTSQKKATAPATGTLEQARERFEREYLEALMQECQGNVSHAAAHAGMHRTSLQRLLSKHDLRSEGFRPI